MKKLLIIGTLLTLSAMLFASGEITISSPGGNGMGTYVEYSGKDVLVSQIPDSTTAPGHSIQLDSGYPFESDVCDDITVPAGDAWALDSIKTWWNNWGSWVGWSNVPNFHVIFYPDSTGFSQPCDSPVVEVVVEAAHYTAYGSNPYSVIIDMTTYGITVPEGTWWIEIQPSSVFSSNGQTGIQEQVGIGNGQESYNRFPLLGTDPWATATATFGSAFEMGMILWGTVPVTGNVWDFEDGWQNWVHSNGAAFPAGWAVVSTSYMTPPPAAGDSMFCIDSDAAGSAITDTAFSPHFTRAGDWLVWGIYFQDYAGRDTVEVLVRERLGTGQWGPWSVVFQYTTDTSPTTDSADVSALGDTLQVAFYYWAGDWDWYAAFDNVGPWLDTFTLAVEETPVEMPQVFNYRMLSTNPIANNIALSVNKVPIISNFFTNYLLI